MPIQPRLFAFYVLLFCPLAPCLLFGFPSMADLGAGATREDVERDRLYSDIERHVG